MKILFCLLLSVACLLPSKLLAQITNPAELDAIMKNMQRQVDSALNDPKLKKMIDQGKRVNVDSIIAAGRKMSSGPMQSMEPDSSLYTIPKKKMNSLSFLPKKTLSPSELKAYLADLLKKMTPLFQKAFGTPVVNTTAYDAMTISNSAIVAFEAGKLDQAVLLSLNAAVKNPDDPVVLNTTGAILKKGGLEIAAIPVLETALQKDPGNSTVQNNLGQSYLSLGDREKAEQYLMQCVRTSTYHPFANSSLAIINLERGNKQAALSYVENSLKGAFTDKSLHLLNKLKKNAVLMDYLRHRFKQPEYFNDDKYKLPMQCEKVQDLPEKRGEYKAYRDMVEQVKKEFEKMREEEGQLAKESMLKKLKNNQMGTVLKTPFMELGAVMMLDLTRRMDKDGWEEISNRQQVYHEKIKQLQKEYHEKSNKTEDCGQQIGLSNDYMEKMSHVTQEYQKAYLRIYKDFYNEGALWSYFMAQEKHGRKANFCGMTASLLGVLHQLAETHFLDPPETDCDPKGESEKDVEKIEIEQDCPIGKDGFEFPFGVGKLNLSCEKVEFQIGEVLILNIGHNFSTGETIFALGPGVSLIGPGHEAVKRIPALHLGPLEFSVDVGAKAQAVLVFKEGVLIDYGGSITAEIDILGIAKEFKTGFSVGMNSDFKMEEGPLRDALDKFWGPDEEVQENKNIKIFKDHQ